MFFIIFRWARSTTVAPLSQLDGDLDASGDRSFAYTERILFKPERARAVNNGVSFRSRDIFIYIFISIFISIFLSNFISIFISNFISIFISIFISFLKYIFLFIYLSITMFLTIYKSIYICIYIFISIKQSISLSILYIHKINISLYLSSYMTYI